MFGNQVPHYIFTTKHWLNSTQKKSIQRGYYTMGAASPCMPSSITMYSALFDMQILGSNVICLKTHALVMSTRRFRPNEQLNDAAFESGWQYKIRTKSKIIARENRWSCKTKQHWIYIYVILFLIDLKCYFSFYNFSLSFLTLFSAPILHWNY